MEGARIILIAMLVYLSVGLVAAQDAPGVDVVVVQCRSDDPQCLALHDAAAHDDSRVLVTHDQSKVVVTRNGSTVAVSHNDSRVVVTQGDSEVVVSPAESTIVVTRGDSAMVVAHDDSQVMVTHNDSTVAMTHSASEMTTTRAVTIDDSQVLMTCSMTNAGPDLDLTHTLTHESGDSELVMTHTMTRDAGTHTLATHASFQAPAPDPRALDKIMCVSSQVPYIGGNWLGAFLTSLYGDVSTLRYTSSFLDVATLVSSLLDFDGRPTWSYFRRMGRCLEGQLVEEEVEEVERDGGGYDDLWERDDESYKDVFGRSDERHKGLLERHERRKDDAGVQTKDTAPLVSFILAILEVGSFIVSVACVLLTPLEASDVIVQRSVN